MKIAITGNFIRFSEKDLFNVNVIEWIYQMMGIAFEEEKNIKLEYLFSPKIDRDNFFVNDEIVAKNTWELFQEENSKLKKKNLNKILFKYDLIIGFELPPSLCHILSEEKVKYINLFIHPVRFLPDLLWYFVTNDKKIDLNLRKWNYSFKLIDTYINDLKKLSIKQCAKIKREIKQDTLLIIGQTEKDSSLLINGKFAKLNDYLLEIKKISSLYKNILILPHPYSNSRKDIESLAKEINNAVIVNYNIYSLLLNKEVKAVLTLSSSVGVEAELFGKDVYFLIGPALRKGGSMVENDSYAITIGQEILLKQFWKNLLEQDDGDNIITISETFKIPNLFRNIFGSWAYEEYLLSDKVKEILFSQSKYLSKIKNIDTNIDKLFVDTCDLNNKMDMSIKKNEELAQKNEELAQKNEVIKSEIEAIKRSRSWKMITLLKKIFFR